MNQSPKPPYRSRFIRFLGLPCHYIAVYISRLIRRDPHSSCIITKRRVEMVVGVIIMGIGVSLTKMAPEHGPLHFIADTVGYAIHGLGLIPFAKLAETFMAEY